MTMPGTTSAINSFTLHSNWVNWQRQVIVPSEVVVQEGIIVSITPLANGETASGYLMPGLVDAHVHIESSMLRPSSFGRWAAAHGTVATVSDPHEIANVLGKEGVRYMIREAKRSPIHHALGVPSCVPATKMETAGAELLLADIRELLEVDGLTYLAEMMNYPAVINQDEAVMAIINLCHELGKPVDGHAPGVRGEALKQYVAAGISTCHESFTLPEALEKLGLGMMVIIREGSAARNFEALHPVISTHAEMVMFCSDDKHPDDLVQGHINLLVKRALAHGHDFWKVLQVAAINPAKHYNLPVGLCQVGHVADMILVDDLQQFNVLHCWKAGQLVGELGKPVIEELAPKERLPNLLVPSVLSAEQFSIAVDSGAAPRKVNVILAEEGQLVTKATEAILTPTTANGRSILMPDVEQDVLQLAVVNRYRANEPVALGFIKGFGLKKGALASTVAHDSHNLLVIGTDAEAMCHAAREVLNAGGGIAVTSGADAEVNLLPLPIAGLMSPHDAETVARAYTALNEHAAMLGCTLKAPFMTLSFMALLVIPELKLSDLGLFDARQWSLVDTLAE